MKGGGGPSAVGDNTTKLFESIRTCVAYLNTIAPSNKTTLYRHINSGKPYQVIYVNGKVKKELHLLQIRVYKLIFFMFLRVKVRHFLHLGKQLYLLPLSILQLVQL